jgi:predicted transcriptional regulator
MGTQKHDVFTFIRAWQLSSTQQEVADKLGLTVLAVRAKACRLRDKGIGLKKFHGEMIDVGEANRLIRKIGCKPRPTNEQGKEAK